jgi:3-hydroxymyristoyl/3-hydroxydecanoyl-(acyl carrier protein) dehydratase
MWYSLLALNRITQDEILAQVTVSGSSPWFSGHFPENPILPGIAQLNMVAEVIARARNENLCIRRLNRVKFKRLVKPDEILEIRAVAASGGGLYSFRITHATEDVCSGTMSLANK